MTKNLKTLLLYDDILHIYLENNILTVKLLGESFTDEIIDKMFCVIELFYDICKNKDQKFHTIYDITNGKLVNLPNYLYYINSFSTFLQKHSDFYSLYLHNTLIITKSNLGKTLCNSVLINYTPTRPIKFITETEPIDLNF